VKITKQHLRRIIKEAQWGNFTGGAAALDVPMRDSDPVPKDQLRKMANIFMNDMGMSPEEVLAKHEFVEQGITDLRQLDESKMKITKRQLRRIIKEEKKNILNEAEQHVLLSAWDQAIGKVEAVEKELYGLEDPHSIGEMTPFGDVLGKQLAAAITELNQAYGALELHFDDESGRNPGGSIG
jgi:hypothetical protein